MGMVWEWERQYKSDHGLKDSWPGPGECQLAAGEGVSVGESVWSHENEDR